MNIFELIKPLHYLYTFVNMLTEKHGRHRMRREIRHIDLTIEQSVDPHVRNILLESIGNAGLHRSRDAIVLHMEPDLGDEAWRRAAIHALRKYDCHQVKQDIYRLMLPQLSKYYNCIILIFIVIVIDKLHMTINTLCYTVLRSSVLYYYKEYDYFPECCIPAQISPT